MVEHTSANPMVPGSILGPVPYRGMMRHVSRILLLEWSTTSQRLWMYRISVPYEHEVTGNIQLIFNLKTTNCMLFKRSIVPADQRRIYITIPTSSGLGLRLTILESDKALSFTIGANTCVGQLAYLLAYLIFQYVLLPYIYVYSSYYYYYYINNTYTCHRWKTRVRPEAGFFQ